MYIFKRYTRGTSSRGTPEVHLQEVHQMYTFKRQTRGICSRGTQEVHRSGLRSVLGLAAKDAQFKNYNSLDYIES